jgi:hypothetical protein
MRWTKKTIIEKLRDLQAGGADLSYAHAEAENLHILRAATWHFGSWRLALEAAGLNAEEIARYQKWSRERIVERIQELHAQGHDLSWREVSLHVDPPLAAAALRSNGFSSWREAITAAGLEIEEIARYEQWSPERISREIRERHAQSRPLSSKAAQAENPALFCAARRRFGSWDAALEAAGLDAAQVRLRKPRGSHAGARSSTCNNAREDVRQASAAKNSA